MVFRQALPMAEADAAVGQRAMPLQQARPAAGEMRQLVAWDFRVHRLWDVFLRRGVDGRGLSERRYFFADIMLGRLHHGNVSGHLLLLAAKDSEIVRSVRTSGRSVRQRDY